MNQREITGIALAPIGPALMQGVLMGNMGAFVFGAIFSYAFALFIGLPVFIFTRRKGWTSSGQMFLAGGLAGLVPGLIIMSLSGVDNFSLSSTIAGMAIFVAYGAVVALLFWFIAYFNAKPE